MRIWSVSRIEQGAGAVPVRDGAQVGGKLEETADVGRVVFNLPLHTPYWYFLPRDRAIGSLFSSASGKAYAVLAQAPAFNPFRAGSPKGGLTHLDEYQAYEKQAGDASLRITLYEGGDADDRRQPRAASCVGVPGPGHVRPGPQHRPVPRAGLRRVGGR